LGLFPDFIHLKIQIYTYHFIYWAVVCSWGSADRVQAFAGEKIKLCGKYRSRKKQKILSFWLRPVKNFLCKHTSRAFIAGMHRMAMI